MNYAIQISLMALSLPYVHVYFQARVSVCNWNVHEPEWELKTPALLDVIVAMLWVKPLGPLC